MVTHAAPPPAAHRARAIVLPAPGGPVSAVTGPRAPWAMSAWMRGRGISHSGIQGTVTLDARSGSPAPAVCRPEPAVSGTVTLATIAPPPLPPSHHRLATAASGSRRPSPPAQRASPPDTRSRMHPGDPSSPSGDLTRVRPPGSRAPRRITRTEWGATGPAGAGWDGCGVFPRTLGACGAVRVLRDPHSRSPPCRSTARLRPAQRLCAPGRNGGARPTPGPGCAARAPGQAGDLRRPGPRGAPPAGRDLTGMPPPAAQRPGIGERIRHGELARYGQPLPGAPARPNHGSGSAAAQPLVHLAAPHDHVREHADEREHQDQDQPPGLGPAAEVTAAEDVDDDPDEQVHPDQPDEEEHHGQERVEQRVPGHL